MNIEKQVCTLEQAKKLKLLGVNSKCMLGFIEIPSNGLSVHAYWKDDKYALINADIVMFCGNGEERWYAPNVAELGVMLEMDDDKHFLDYNYNNHGGSFQCYLNKRDQRKGDGFKNITIEEGDTEAECRAEMLIYLLENKITKLVEVNERLAA